jgi:hypothetical protein
MDVDAETALGSLNSNRVGVETPNQPTQSPPSTRLQQASQMNAELEQRRNTTMKRKEETAMNHRGEVFKHSKPTLAQQILNIQPPRVVPENIPIFSSGDEALQPTKVKRKNLNATISASSSQAPMDVSSKPKRGTPETDVEPKGKAGRPKIKYVDLRPDAEKRDGDEMPEETNRKKSKRTNTNKEKMQKKTGSKNGKRNS